MLNPTDVQVDAGDLLPVDWSKAMFTVASPPIFSPQHIWKKPSGAFLLHFGKSDCILVLFRLSTAPQIRGFKSFFVVRASLGVWTAGTSQTFLNCPAADSHRSTTKKQLWAKFKPFR